MARADGPPAGWYADPADLSVKRYWDGEGWLGASVPAGTDTNGFGPLLAPGDPTARTGSAAAMAAAGPERATAQILFHGRQLTVQMPTAEQLLVFQRVGRELQIVGSSPPDLDRMSRAINRALKIIDALLPNEVDRDWLEDATLSGEVSISDAASILTEAVRLMPQMDDNRAARRGSRPKARVRRQ